MKKNLAKLIALMMALVLVFSFAACGGDKDEQPSDTTNEAVVNTEDTATPDATGDTAASDGTSDTAAPGEPGDTAAPGSTNKTDPPAPGGVAAPTDKAAGVKLYNDALGKVSSTTTYVDRKLTKKKIMGIDLDTFGDVSGTFAKGSGNVNVKLSALSAGDVKDYSYTTSGNNYVMTFELGTVKGSTNLKHGNGGYMYFLTMDEVEKTVLDIGNILSGGNFEIEMFKDKSTIELQGGKLVVTVDKNTGKMSKATLTFKEVIEGKCKAAITGPFAVNATADLIGEGTVTFTVK